MDEIENPFDVAVNAVVHEYDQAISSLASLTDEPKSDAFVQFARDINPGAMSRRSLLAIDDVERVLWQDCNDFLSPEDEQQDWTSIARPQLTSGWLRKNLQDEIMEMERCFRDLKGAAADYGRFWKRNEGLGGFVARALNGYANPLDGWMHIVGKGSTQTEQEQWIEALADAFSEARNSIETTVQEIILRTRQKFSKIKSEHLSPSNES